MFFQVYMRLKIPLTEYIHSGILAMSKQTVTDADKSIGQRIQKRRRELDISAAQLSELLALSQQQLSRYERGTNKINISHLINIASILDVPIAWFFLDCKADIPSKVMSDGSHYVSQLDIELKQRFEQQWAMFTLDQKRAVVSMFDSLLSK